MLVRIWGKRYTHTLLVGLQIGATTLETAWRFLTILGMEPPFDQAIPLLSLYLKDLKSAYYSDAVASMFIAAQFAITKLWNQPRCPSTYTQ